MKKDRSLLFGLLAVSMKKVRPDKLSEVARRTQTNPQAELGQSLVDEGLLSLADKEHLDSLVELSLAEHAGDASATIQALGKEPEKLATVIDSMDDFIAAFEQNSGAPPASSAGGGGPLDSILGDFSESESLVGDAPPPDSIGGGDPMLDSLLGGGDDSDPARTRITQSGSTGDRGSVGDIVHQDAPDSFFESIGSTGTQISSPVRAAAELDESEIVPAVAEHRGRYETIREFAKGGMGQITLVHDTHLGRDVALKQLLQQHIIPGTQHGAPTTALLTIPIIARFLQEARITGQLEHPSIIPVYELGYRADGSLYYTMKLVRGQSMHEFLKEAKTLNDRLPLLTHFLDLCQAISYAHSRGVIHRDLKPMNLMIGEFGETVVIDWGIAKVRGEDDIHAKGLQETVTAMRVSSAEATAKTMYGQTIGSPYFMPAEQAMGRTDLIDERSDIYSLGAVLYTILTGTMPYAGNNVREFMEKVGQVEPKPVRMLEPAVRPELAAICTKAMALIPENRYQSAKELTDDIQKYLSGGMVDAYTYNLSELVKRFVKKHKKALSVAAFFIVAAIGFGIFYNINITIQKNAAIAARNEAEVQRGIAVEQEAVAVEQREIAITERDNAQQQLYYANIANTRFNINEQQMAKARELLAACEPAELRQWEWGYLEAEAHADLITLDRGGRFNAFTPDGAGLIAGTVRGSVSLHDVESGELLHEFVNRGGNGYAAAASADGGRIAVRSDTAVQVWDTATRAELVRFDEPEETDTRHHLALAPNGRYVAALNSDKVTRVWDVDSGEVALVIEDCNQVQGFGLFFNADASLLLVARQVFGDEGWERRFELFEIPGGTVAGSYTMPADSVLSVHAAAFSPDSARLALGTDDRLLLWDVAGFKQVAAVPRHKFFHPDIVAFSPDGNYVAAGDNEGGLLLCDRDGGVLNTIPKGHEDVIRAVRFSRSGTRLATVGDDRTVRLWSVPGLRPLHTYRGHGSSIFTAAFSGDDTRLATSAFDGESKIWDLSADLEFAPAELPGFRLVTYSPEGGVVAGTTGGEVVVWNARSGHRLQALTAHEVAAKAVALNRTGTLVASIGQEEGAEMLRVWDVATGELRERFPTGVGNTSRLDFVLGDNALLIGAGRSLLRADREAGAATPLFDEALAERIGNSTPVYLIDGQGTHAALCFGTAGTFAAVLLNLADGAVAASLDVPEVTALRAYFTPEEGQILLARSDRHVERGGTAGGSVSLWNTGDSTATEPIAVHEGQPIHTGGIAYATFSRDGQFVATGGDQGDTVIWSYDGAALGYVSKLRGHTGAIKAIDFSPDGNRIVTGSDDRTFKIWDVTSGKLILTLQEAAVLADVQVARPTQVAFSPDGLHLATITEPPVSPMILHAFSTDMADYPEVPVEGELAGTPEEQAAAQLEARMEAYKRLYWRN